MDGEGNKKGVGGLLDLYCSSICQEGLRRNHDRHVSG